MPKTSDRPGRPSHAPIVVGVDGSESGQDALIWAAAEASAMRRPLRIVHAFTWPLLGSPLELALVAPVDNGIQVEAERILDRAERHARALAPGIKVTGELMVAPAASALLRQVGDAELVVVGNRGAGGFAGLLVGSVSVAMAAHAPCPVVVVHPHQQGRGRPGASAGRVVVGVDGSELSTAAVRFAFLAAARRGVGVTAVHARAVPARRHPATRVPLGSVEQVARRHLIESLAEVRTTFPDVDVRTRLVRCHPALALVAEAAGADLVVVGSRGRGGVAGTLLGSVSQAVLRHAGCPVAVVRPHR